MSAIPPLIRRFEELDSQLQNVLATKYYKSGDYLSGDYVDNELLLNWTTKARNLMSKACGEESVHFRDFQKASETESWETNHSKLIRMKAVFNAAHEDYAGGYCQSVRTLVQAEVFDNELEQARSLQSSGHHSAAAVIAGTVLETTLGQLCDDLGLERGKLDKMNADLAKAGQYSKLKQKQITALADIRNSAAHGNNSAFTSDDVARMIDQTEIIVRDELE